MQSLKLSTAEAATLCKENGYKISADSIARGISAGTVPFGRVVATGKSGRNTYEIWRKDVVAFLREKGAAVE